MTDETSGALALDDETLHLSTVTVEVHAEPEASTKAWSARATIAPGQTMPNSLLDPAVRTLTLDDGTTGLVQVEAFEAIGETHYLNLIGKGPKP